MARRAVGIVLVCLMVCGLQLGAGEVAKGTKVIGYYTSWAHHSGFTPDKIKWDALTHVNHAFMGLNNDAEMVESEDYLATKQALIKEAHAHNVKVLACLNPGSHACGVTIVQALINDEEKRAKLVRNIYDYLRENGYDGLVINWEHPGLKLNKKCKWLGTDRKLCVQDKANVTKWLRELRQAFDQVEPPLLLSFVVGLEEKCLDGPAITPYVDWIEIMVYLQHNWAPDAGHNCALFVSRQDDCGRNESAAVSVKYWRKKQRIPREKIMVGLPFYAVKNKGADLSAPIKVPSGRGIAYRNVVEYHIGKGWTRHWDDDAKVPYLLKDEGNGFISYNDPESLRLKVKWGTEQKLGGFMIWELSQGVLKDGSQPLLEAISQALGD